MRKTHTTRQGLAAVELALLLPVMALLFMLIMEGSNAMHTYSSLVEASREGARHVLIEGDDANVPALVASLVTDLNTQDLNTNVIKNGMANTVTVQVSYVYVPFSNSNNTSTLGENNAFELVAETTMPLP